jgi:hypothetical protein
MGNKIYEYIEVFVCIKTLCSCLQNVSINVKWRDIFSDWLVCTALSIITMTCKYSKLLANTQTTPRSKAFPIQQDDPE